MKTNSVFILIVAAVSLCPMQARAALLAYEPFDYGPAGADLLGKNGGGGFSGPWRFISSFPYGTATTYDLASASLSFSYLQAAENSVRCGVSGAANLNRALASPMGAPGTTRYVSFLVRPDGALGLGPWFGLLLEASTARDLYYGHLVVGNPGDGPADNYVLESSGGTGIFASANPIVPGQTAFLVVKAEFTAGLDRFTLYVNPTPGGPEPSSGTVKNDSDVGTVNSIFIASSGLFTLDEIRIGETFADVTPAAYPGLPVALALALDNTNLVWTSGGSVLWGNQTSVTHDGIDAAQAGGLPYQECWLQTTVTGPGTVAFWWKVSSELDYDFLEFYGAGVLQSRISGEVDWQRLSFPVPAGPQTLRWRYVKDGSADLGQDKAWVDEVVFLPSAGPPVVLTQPVSQTVGPGETASFGVGVAGSLPQTYQWFFNETTPIDGGTNATLTLLNVQLAEAGNYRVTVSNADGTVTSSDAALTVTVNGPVNTILLFADDASNSPYKTALLNLGRSHQLFTDATAFEMAVTGANPADTLVVVDAFNSNHNFNSVADFANAGGRALLHYYRLGSSLAAAFQATVVSNLSTALPVHDWGGSPFFDGVGSPLNLTDLYNFDGQKLQASAGGMAVGGFTGTLQSTQASIVIGHSGRTILNGFILQEASPSASGVRLAENQIQSLLDFAMPRAPFIASQPRSQAVLTGRPMFLYVGAGGSPPLSYAWRKDGLEIVGATNSSHSITSVQSNHFGAYTVVVTNRHGAVTSGVATLELALPPTIVQQPQSQTVVAGENATFTVTVTNNASLPIGYQLRKGTLILTNVVLSARTCSLTLYRVTTNSTPTNGPGNYRIVATNAASLSGVASSVAALTVTVPPVLTAWAFSENRHFRLQFTSLAGAAHRILASTNLTQWEDIAPAIETAPGVFEFTDTNASGHAWRFYRVRRP